MSFTESESKAVNDIRPIVPTGSRSNWEVWVFAAVLLIGGFSLFNALTASEETANTPSVFAPQQTGGARIASPPPLRTPERFDPVEPEQRTTERALSSRAPERAATIVSPILPPIARPALPPRTLEPLPSSSPAPASPEPPRVVFEAPARNSTRSGTASVDGSVDRVSADRLRNPSRTIPQGTVIPAVLETALDSTRPGGVRALVQRDVSSFDGTRVLIPRGSRLYGEYQSDLQSGQNRALVQWTRLIRPDGVTIALDSPSSDPLGRAGIRGRVDTKFFQRFGGAILQSVLDIGVGLAVNEASDGVIVALPGSTQNVQVTQPQQIQPTLKVRHGASVSVFVARDLDFSSVDP